MQMRLQIALPSRLRFGSFRLHSAIGGRFLAARRAELRLSDGGHSGNAWRNPIAGWTHVVARNQKVVQRRGNRTHQNGFGTQLRPCFRQCVDNRRTLAIGHGREGPAMGHPGCRGIHAASSRPEEARMLNRSQLVAAVILITVTAASAVWRGPSQMIAALDDETRDWVVGLSNKIGSPCCDTADGFPVEWDMAGTVDDTSGMSQFEANYARSGYRVRLSDGKWYDVPNFAVINPKTNKLGYAVVWLIPVESWGSAGAIPQPSPSFQIHCFLPGAGG
jgi:hypothetical protein